MGAIEKKQALLAARAHGASAVASEDVATKGTKITKGDLFAVSEREADELRFRDAKSFDKGLLIRSFAR